MVEQSHLPARQTLDKLGSTRTSFYRWYDRFLPHGVECLEDRTSASARVWNRIPDDIRDRIITMALDHADLSGRELAVKLTDTESYFVSEASVCRLLKEHDLIMSRAYIVIKACDEFKDKTTRPTGSMALLASADARENRTLAPDAEESQTSKRRSQPSSSATTIADTTRASTISPRPTSTSGAARPSFSNAKGSNETPSDGAA